METISAERVLREAFEKIERILVEEFGREPEDIAPDSSFRGDLGFDSLEVAELVLNLEEVFGCEIPDDDMAKIATIEQAIDYALAHTKDRDAA